MKKVLILTLFIVSFVYNALSQVNGGSLKGTVLDAKTGEPIIGANVIVEGSKLGSSTNVDGVFVIQLGSAKAETIRISYLGYITQKVKASNNIVIKLKEDSQMLDEFVVVGYGTQKKTSLTGAVETISNKALLQVPTPNLGEALNGQVAGLQVMSSTGDPSSNRQNDIRIRGISGNPLLVIDGVPRFGVNTSDGDMSLNDINPDDVESISILKDAASAAVYGARAANGVILVNTKSGKKGQKVKISYRGQVNVTAATALPDFLDSYQFAQLYNQAVANTEGTPYKAYTQDELEMIRTQSNPDKFANSNLIDNLNKYAMRTSHNISASGGGNVMTYYTSLGYNKSTGLYSGIGNDRLNYTIKLDANLMKDLKLSINTTGAISDNKNSSYGTIDGAYSVSPLEVLRYSNGDLVSIEGSNPLINIEGLGGYIQNKFNYRNINTRLTYKPSFIKGLSTYIMLSYDYNTRRNKTFDEPVTLYRKDDSGKIVIDPKTTYPKRKITLSELYQITSGKLLEYGINYNNTFAGKHDVSALIVVNYQDNNIESIDGKNNDMPGIYPEILGTSIDSRLVGSEFYNQRASLVGRLNYGYANRYFVETSFRLDGSTKFSPENRWGFFPTISASWVISNENWFKNWEQNIWSNFKMRASTGILGNDGSVSYFSYLFNYKFLVNQGYQIGGQYRPGLALETGNYPNPNLQWGKSKDYNIAFDLGFFGNRLELSWEQYLRYRTNDIQSAPAYLFPPSVGADGAVPSINFGKVKAWGWDLTLRYRDTFKKDWKYNVSLTMSKTNDKVLDFGDESSLKPERRRKGRPYMVWSLYQDDGLFQSVEEIANYNVDQDGRGNTTLAPGDIKYKDVNNDGVIDENDKVFVKNSSYPDMSLSLRMGLEYKGFFINTMLQGVSGYNQRISEVYSLYNNSLPRFQKYHLKDSWTSENPSARYPRIKFATTTDNNRKESTFWLQNCDFIRLKTLSIGYNIPSKTIKKIGLNNMSIALQGMNLFTLSSLRDNMDPESLRGYPIQRSMGVSVSMGF